MKKIDKNVKDGMIDEKVGVMENKEIGKLVEALAKAQLEFEPVLFDKTNPHFKNKYATLSSLEKATKEALANQGICILQFFQNQPNGDLLLTTRLAHSSGEHIDSDYLIVRGNKTDQQLGSSITYGRRFSYASILSISAEDDDDGEEDRKQAAKSAPIALLSREQVQELKQLIGTDTELTIKLTTWLKVKTIHEITAPMFETCVKAIHKWKENAAKEANHE